jgi:hypothetical protein
MVSTLKVLTPLIQSRKGGRIGVRRRVRRRVKRGVRRGIRKWVRGKILDEQKVVN